MKASSKDEADEARDREAIGGVIETCCIIRCCSAVKDEMF